VMGRKTFESLPRLLPGRRHIVMTRDPNWEAPGAEAAHDTAGALALADAQNVSVIGGAKIFQLFLPIADRVELTEVHARPEGDTVLPRFDNHHWRMLGRESHPARDGQPAFSFLTLVRKP